MKASNVLSSLYLAGASAFAVAVGAHHHAEWSKETHRVQHQAEVRWHRALVNADKMTRPIVARIVKGEKRLLAQLQARSRAEVHVPSPQHVATVPGPRRGEKPHPSALPLFAKRAVDVLTGLRLAIPDHVPEALVPDFEVARNAPPPDAAPASNAQVQRVAERLNQNLTHEMRRNFKLFLYVNKAESGPIAQRMYVFRKDERGHLAALYNWPVSTGRERVEYAPNGKRAPSFTPAGYYELDPDRMYRHHMSGQWRQPMPHAMFFNWEKAGYKTGLAIHGATKEDVAELGKRASAGCVRLSPKNAALLFNLIRAEYRGPTPRFDYDSKTQTMSNDGALMHDENGRIAFADGYEVLVFIENYGGNDVVAALY